MMNHRGRAAGCRFRLLLLALAVGLPGTPTSGRAHEVLAHYVQHRVRLVVDVQYVDVVIELRFFEEWSARERRRMDRNRDGQIRREEIEDYLQLLAPTLNRQVRLVIGGRPQSLTPLYAAEADLLGCAEASRGHHALRLHYFAPTPPDLAAGSDLVLEDGLWLGAPALAGCSTAGRSGCRLELEPETGLGFPAAQSGERRRFTVRCVYPPTSLPDATVPAADLQ